MPCPYKIRTHATAEQIQSNVKGAQLKLAATLRSRTAGSQDESPCRAIHKFKSNGRREDNRNCKGWRSEDRRYECATYVRWLGAKFLLSCG